MSTQTKSNNNSITIEIVQDSGTNSDCGSECFSPNKVFLARGGKITFKNSDVSTHRIMDSLNGMDRFPLKPNDITSMKFTKMGTYDFGCFIHPWMKGTVVVSS